MITKGNPGKGRVTGLYDITIFNAIGGEQIVFIEEQKKKEPRLSTCRKMSTVCWLLYSLNRNQK